MSMSETWDTLQIARDARLEGRWEDASKLYDEVKPDFDYVRCTVRRPCPPFILDEYADEYEDRDEVGVQVAEHRERIEGQDWLAWWNPLKTSSLDGALREAYGAADVSQMAARPNPALSMLRRSDEVFEMRIRSYANLIAPMWHGVFTGVD